jgi:hypothetical protein
MLDAGYASRPRSGDAEVLDAEMQPSDIVETLKRLRFSGGLCTIRMDGHTRDYLLAAVSARCGIKV